MKARGDEIAYVFFREKQMHPVVRSASRTRSIKILSGKAPALGDVDLDKLALMDGQLDGAETQFGECIQHRADWLGKRSFICLRRPLFSFIGHRHPLLEEQLVAPFPSPLLKLKYFS